MACLFPALRLRGPAVRLPPVIRMAIERTTREPKPDRPPVRFASQALALGVEPHVIGGVDVPVCDAAGAVVDRFRCRDRFGADAALRGPPRGHPPEVGAAG